MSYSLEDFCADTRAILKARDDAAGRDEVREKLEQLLQDPDFCAEYVGPESKAGLEQIFEDPEQLEREVAELEKQMHAAAERLEFEKAAECRDRIRYLREKALLT